MIHSFNIQWRIQNQKMENYLFHDLFMNVIEKNRKRFVLWAFDFMHRSKTERLKNGPRAKFDFDT